MSSSSRFLRAVTLGAAVAVVLVARPETKAKPTPPKEWSYIEWAEKAAIENLRGRIANADSIGKEANTLVTLLLAGIGGSLAYAFKAFDDGSASPAACGAAAVAVWFAIVAAIVLWRCVMTRPLSALMNEPKNIYRPELQLSEVAIRQFELENLQLRIDETKERNRKVALWLDRGRLAAIATPLIFAIAVVVAVAAGLSVYKADDRGDQDQVGGTDSLLCRRGA
jgi:hypothetical protein